MKQPKGQISANEAVRRLLEQDENGKYIIGDLSGNSERENLTRVVSILNQINLTENDEKGFNNLKKALGMIGAYDRYGYLIPQEKINNLREFNEKSKNGDMVPARMYVNKFFGNMDIFSRAEIEDKFSDIMSMWVDISEGMIKKDTNVTMKQFTQSALSEGIGEHELGDGEIVVGEQEHEQ